MDAVSSTSESAPKRKRRWLRWIGYAVLLLIVALCVGRLFLPQTVRWYVNRTIDQNPLYDGVIGDVKINLWRGAYSIENIRLNKTTGNVPVPFFSAKRLDFSLEWGALLHGRMVVKILIDEPQLNFVDSGNSGGSQSGAGGPWLAMLDDLAPFKINSTLIQNGSVHFHAFDRDPPVDVYLERLNASIENLSNVKDEISPLLATVKASAVAMGSGNLDLSVRLDPRSYRPTFQLAVKMVGLDVTKLNLLTRAYGAFDFDKGWFDLVLEVDAKEGGLDGYVQPLFRNLSILSRRDVKEDNLIELFWEALLGGVSNVLQNQPRQQLATRIPFTGSTAAPQTDILTAIGNVLRNGFVRAYLPRLQGKTDVADMEFQPGAVLDPTRDITSSR